MELRQKYWADINGYKGIYQVSTDGEIRMCTTGKIMSQVTTHNGYKRIKLSKEWKSKMFMVHRLVCQAFYPNSDISLEVNHINGIKHDNRLENLEWVSKSENRKHGYRIGLIVNKKGADNPMCKPVIQRDLNGNEIARYVSLTEACKQTGLSLGTVSKGCLERKSQKGYKWEYSNV